MNGTFVCAAWGGGQLCAFALLWSGRGGAEFRFFFQKGYSGKRRHVYLVPQYCPFSPFFEEGAPTKIDCRKKQVPFVLTSLLEDLV